MNTQWFRDRLADKKLSQRRLAKMLEIDPAAVSLMFRGMRRITPHEAHQISVILGVPLNEVMRNAGIEVTEDVRRCPVAAHVDENGVVTTMPPRTHDDVIGPGDCPVGTFAIQVRSHSSTKDGWLLFVTPAQVAPAENIDQLCLVATGDGRQILAVVRRGYRRDTHNLIIWPSNEMISDASIVWTSTVLWIKPLY
jgi:DNA-binding transcriptional regulator YdaS (Cro superfamily)